MTRLTKRSGTQEEFRRNKAEESLRLAGAAEDLIDATLRNVTPTDGESTASFRGRIITELRSRSPEVARTYESSRRLDADRSEDVAEGTARVNPTTLRSFGWNPGATVNAQHGNATVAVKIEESNQAGTRTVRFNPRTLDSLGAIQGTRVSLTQKR